MCFNSAENFKVSVAFSRQIRIILAPNKIPWLNALLTTMAGFSFSSTRGPVNEYELTFEPRGGGGFTMTTKPLSRKKLRSPDGDRDLQCSNQ